jgi:hypothetical protein
MRSDPSTPSTLVSPLAQPSLLVVTPRTASEYNLDFLISVD